MSSFEAGAAADPLAFIARPTPQLRATIAHQKTVLPEADFNGMMGAIRSAFEKYTAKLLEFSPGIERAQVVHKLVDRESSSAWQLPISCRKGCCGCCHFEVEVTTDEAALLAAVVRAGTEIDRGRLEAQAARERLSPEWQKLGAPENRCVFLGDDGACRTYEFRPAACRKLLVTSAPEACTTVGGAVAPVQLLLVDLILSAALSLEGVRTASLSKMLLAELAPPA